jgi:hypothetical protein
MAGSGGEAAFFDDIHEGGNIGQMVHRQSSRLDPSRAEIGVDSVRRQ